MSSRKSVADAVLKLQRLADAARREGNDDAACALERSISELKCDGPIIGTAISELIFGSSAAPFSEADMAKWSLLRPRSVFARDAVGIIDCGERGRITIIDGAILIKGSIAHEPLTAMLIADHAKHNHGGRGTAFGSPEFQRNIATANLVTGTTIQSAFGGTEPTALQQVASGWAPMLATIRSAAPSRPRGRTQSAAPIEVPSNF